MYKIDTKEIFHVISMLESELSAKMAEELDLIVAKTQEKNRKSVILKLDNVVSVDLVFSEKMLSISKKIKQQNFSFVVCCYSESLKKDWVSSGIAEALNLAPTESEAWDIVQMEEIERELGADL